MTGKNTPLRSCRPKIYPSLAESGKHLPCNPLFTILLFLLKKLTFWTFALLATACQPADERDAARTENLPADAPRPIEKAAIPVVAEDTIAAPVLIGLTTTPDTKGYAYQVRPGDDTKDNSALQSFVRQVIGYAKNRQRASLVAVADDSIVISYGGGLFGKKDFSDFLADPQSEAYVQIRRALELGGAKKEEKPGEWTYLFPYCQSEQRWAPMPEGEDSDPFTTFIGLVPDLKIHQKPNAESPVYAQLAYPVLYEDDEADGTTPAKSWIRLKTIDGKIRGWVDTRTVYNNASMMVVIAKVAGQYRIMSVAPFD